MKLQKAWLTGFLMSAILLISATTMVSKAQAGFSLCRTDPIITFSDGSVLQIVTDIESDAAQIKSVNYVLHVPTGISATSIEYAESDPVLETVDVISDYPANKYSGTATLVMNDSKAKTKFTVTAVFNNSATAVLSGDSSKTLRLDFKAPATPPAPPAAPTPGPPYRSEKVINRKNTVALADHARRREYMNVQVKPALFVYSWPIRGRLCPPQHNPNY